MKLWNFFIEQNPCGTQTSKVLIENYLFGKSLSIKSYKSKYYGVSGTKKVKLFNPDFHNKKKVCLQCIDF